MRNRSSFLTVLLVVAAAVLGGCNDSPTDPDHGSSPSLSILCLPAGTQVSCTATFLSQSGQHDVTADATWLASDPAVGVFVRPGVFSPAKRGEVEISARYQTIQTHVPFRFLVDPLKPPQYLQFLSGIVYDDAGALLAGATVEILSGYAQGARTTSQENGYYHVNTVLAGETFTVRASKPGYAAATLSYRVDPPVTFGGDPSNSPFLDFRLRRLE